MTLADLKAYLMIRAGGGAVVNPAFDQVASTSIAGAYNHVWGSHRWTVRRAQSIFTASTATNNCPADFERAHWISCQSPGIPHRVLIRTEEGFDNDFPYPGWTGTGAPVECKIVYNPATNPWKIYWFRVPDQAYTMLLSYDRMADLNFFEKLPSHMVKAVQAQALAMMMSTDAQGGNLAGMARAALQEATDADTEVSGVLPNTERDQGWNDFDLGGSRMGDTSNPLNF